jgi:hypothetical protein
MSVGPHNNSTPQSVLDAPVSTPVVISDQRGFSRAERRHGVNVLNPQSLRKHPKGFERGVAQAKAHGPNIPYEKAEDQRSAAERQSLARRIARTTQAKRTALAEKLKQNRSQA